MLSILQGDLDHTERKCFARSILDNEIQNSAGEINKSFSDLQAHALIAEFFLGGKSVTTLQQFLFIAV